MAAPAAGDRREWERQERMGGSEALLPSLHYATERPYRDRGAARVFSLCLGLTFACGSYSIFNSANVNYRVLYDASYLELSSSCPVNGGLKGLQSHEVPIIAFLQSGLGLVASSVLASFISGLAFILLLQHHAAALLLTFVSIQVIGPTCLGLAALALGHNGAALWLFLTAIVMASNYVWGRDQLKLVASLLGLSARALRAKPGVLLVAMGLKLVFAGFALFCQAAVVAAMANGRISPNPDVKHITGERCMTQQMARTACCVWQPAVWSPAYITLAACTLLWSLMLTFEIQASTVAGVVCQWFWSPLGCDGGEGATRQALAHALGPSFGSCCLASLLLCPARVIRSTAACCHPETQQEGLFGRGTACGLSWVWQVLLAGAHRHAVQQPTSVPRACLRHLSFGMLRTSLSALGLVLELGTRFATVRVAMSGQSFLQASRDVVDLLRRNAMDAYSVWWYPGLVLHLGAGLLSSLLGVVTYLVALTLLPSSQPLPSISPHSAAVGLAALTTTWSLFVLSFLSCVLLSCVDAMFVCHAVDRDHHSCGQPEVQEVLSKLPGITTSREGSGSERHYGAPLTPQAQLPGCPFPFVYTTLHQHDPAYHPTHHHALGLSHHYPGPSPQYSVLPFNQQPANNPTSVYTSSQPAYYATAPVSGMPYPAPPYYIQSAAQHRYAGDAVWQ
ncbi:hypothetical protein QJQ45_019711 [Haematococcus lacustris]|nr:hypothetical protein QJQ45_019711 [Haematococcus lacustris]